MMDYSDNVAGMEKASLHELPKISDRLSFLYLEHCQLSREDSSILLRDDEGTIRIPAASITTLLLGPGTKVTHRAIELIGDSGVTIIWVGERGVRYYACGRPLTHRSHLLIRQAELVSNQKLHLMVVRKMYQIRFPDEDISHLTTQQLRGREGSRVKKAYKKASEKWGIEWNGRVYNPNDFSASDLVNQALSAGNVCLYGIAHAVIVAMGCSPGLGFVHVGHENSFVYDVADLYKAEITIPIAFEMAASSPPDFAGAVRRRIRDEIVSTHLLERMVKDIRFLLSKEDEDDIPESDITYLWDVRQGTVSNGKNYSRETDGE